MKKFFLISVIFVVTALSVMANAISYDTPEEIINRIQMEMKHK